MKYYAMPLSLLINSMQCARSFAAFKIKEVHSPTMRLENAMKSTSGLRRHPPKSLMHHGESIFVSVRK